MAQTNNPAPETPQQKITRVYANHALSSLCTQDLMTRFEESKWSASDKVKFWKLYQERCKCLAKEILTVAQPADVIDFARLNFTPTPNKPAPYDEKKISAIANIYYAPIVLKACNIPQ